MVRRSAMGQWIVVIVFYLFGIGIFRLLGGVGAASEALQRWGRATAEKRRRRISATELSSPPTL
jgi:hypothetical protein